MKEQASKLKLTAEYIRREYNEGLCFRYDVHPLPDAVNGDQLAIVVSAFASA